jgi:hypothetical protein
MSDKGGGAHEIRVHITEKRSPSSKHARPFSFSGKLKPKPKQQQQPTPMPEDSDPDDEKIPFHFRQPMDLAKTRLLIVIWLGVVTLGVLFLFIFGSGTTTVHTSLTPIVEKANKNSVSFNLLDTLFTTVPIPDLNFDKLLRYDVCCFQQTYFICRSVTKNLGVDCYLTKEKTAVVRLFHPDMTGARCTILWSESS